MGTCPKIAWRVTDGNGHLPRNCRMNDGCKVRDDGLRGDDSDAVVGTVENLESPELGSRAIHTRAVHLTATGHHQGGCRDRASGRVLSPYKIGVWTPNTEPHKRETRHSRRHCAARTTNAMYPNLMGKKARKSRTKTKKKKGKNKIPSFWRHT